MYIERVLSINNGWSILTNLKGNEWHDIIYSLRTVNDFIIKTGIVNDNPNSQNDSYAIYYLYSSIGNAIRAIDNKWIDKSTNNNQLPILQKLTKNKVSVSAVGLNEYTGGNFLTNIYLNIPYYFDAGINDVTVLLIPTEETISHLVTLGVKLNQLKDFPTEELCRAQLNKFSPSKSKAPVVLAFYSPTAKEKIITEEIVTFKADEQSIERTIEFAPEYYQAGVGLLSYFGEVLRQKDPNIKAKVRIEQEGNIVRLHIESPSGDIEIIEKELEQYALVVSNQAPPESILENQAHIIQLKSQLEMARLQVQTAYEIKQITDGVNAQRFATLEKQVESLNMQLAAQLLQSNKVIDLATQQASSHERMQAALLMHGQLLFKDILEESRGNFQLLTAIQSLHQNLLSGITTIEVEEQIKQALDTVKQQKPGLLARIYSQVEGAALKAGAGASLNWAAELIKHTIHLH